MGIIQGAEYLGVFSSGTHDEALTIPSGATTAFVLFSNQASAAVISSVDIGGVSAPSLFAYNISNQTSTRTFEILNDLGDRADDELHWNGNNASSGVSVVYAAGGDLQTEQTGGAQCSTCNNSLRVTSLTVPVDADDGTFVAIVTGCGRDQGGTTRVAGGTALGNDIMHVAVGDDVGHQYYTDPLSATTDVGMLYGGFNFFNGHQHFVAFDADPPILPDPVGMVMGLTGGTATPDPDQQLNVVPVGMTMGLLPGDVTFAGPREVHLVGNVETPEMTDPPTGDGPWYLKNEAGDKPYWEDEINIGSGQLNVHDESLTDGDSNFIFADGDIVTVVDVPD